jgi:hypothetical protein
MIGKPQMSSLVPIKKAQQEMQSERNKLEEDKKYVKTHKNSSFFSFIHYIIIIMIIILCYCLIFNKILELKRHLFLHVSLILKTRDLD